MARATSSRCPATSALAGRYDLILMDGNPPARGSYDATGATRAAKRAAAPDHSATNGDPTRHVPIVALTATSASHERARALEAGMDDHVHKPLDAAHLATLLRVHVGRTRPSSSPPTTTAPADAA